MYLAQNGYPFDQVCKLSFFDRFWQVCKVKSAKSSLQRIRSSRQSQVYKLFEVCRLTFQSLPTNMQKFADLPCRIILFTKTSLQSQVCKVKSAKSSLQSQVCKHLWSKSAKSSLQTLGKLVGKLTKEFVDLIERVTDLTLQSCIKYLQTNFEKLVCKHVKKIPGMMQSLLIRQSL